MNWLMLRGLIREQRHWEHFPQVFQQQLVGHKTFFLDMPGIGTEKGRKAPSSISEMMEDVRGRFLELKERNPGHWGIMALSMGGMVAMEWTRVYPEDFKKLVLMNTSLSNLSPFYERMDLWTACHFATFFMVPDAAYRERVILARTTSGRTPLADIGRRWTEFAPSLSELRPVALAQLQAAARFRLQERPRIPTLVLTSKGDLVASSRCSQKLAKFLDAPIQVHPWAGHDLTLEDSLWVCDQIKEFVR